MSLKIRKAAVLGAGVMGAQIAAHLAASGVRTYLLDLASDKAPEDPKLKKVVGSRFRSAPAILALENLKKLKPSPLVDSKVLENVIPGNFDDDMSVLADCDWVVEAVIEKMDIKKSIIKRIAQYAKADIPITTNTSGLSMAAMCADEDEFFQKRFFGTHFFNPPRYMKLLEIVPHKHNDMSLVEELATWIEENLGKGIVHAVDTINFIANRVGVYNMMATCRHMEELGLNVETVDALTGKLMGRPASATMRTMDVVGLDTFAHVANNVYANVPNDPHRDIFQTPAWIAELIKNGALGQKSGSVGAYKKAKKDGKTAILAYRPESKTYEEQQVQPFPWLGDAKKEKDLFKRLKFVMDQQDAGGKFVWRVLRDTIAYAALLVEEIANGDLMALDNGIKWGFNWEQGPFMLWQGLGYDWVLNRMREENVQLPAWCQPSLELYTPTPGSMDWELTGPIQMFHASRKGNVDVAVAPHIIKLPVRQNAEDKRVVSSCKSGSLLDIGDGVSALVFHSKMNSLNGELIEFITKSVGLVESDFDALVIANDGDAFSAGADLREFLGAIDKKDFDAIDGIIRNFQVAMQMIKFASFPSISAPHGLVLGGGCEVSLHTTNQLVGCETYAGLVEVGVGLLPAGGGTKELALKAYELAEQGENVDPMPFLQRAFTLIGMAKVSTSGAEAIENGLYNRKASVTMSADHQTQRAKKMALELYERRYIRPTPKMKIKVAGDPGIQTFKMMLYNMVQGRMISPYDAYLGEQIATILCGGAVDAGQTVTEQYLLDLERVGFVELCKQPKTRDRIEHMLKTGKPLRN